jgi:hypothetical protein
MVFFVGGVLLDNYLTDLILTINKNNQSMQPIPNSREVALDTTVAILQKFPYATITGSSAVNYHAPGSVEPNDVDLVIPVSKISMEGERSHVFVQNLLPAGYTLHEHVDNRPSFTVRCAEGVGILDVSFSASGQSAREVRILQASMMHATICGRQVRVYKPRKLLNEYRSNARQKDDSAKILALQEVVEAEDATNTAAQPTPSPSCHGEQEEQHYRMRCCDLIHASRLLFDEDDCE